MIRSAREAIYNSRSCTNVRITYDLQSPQSQKLTLNRTKSDDGTLFLGEGSLAGVPSQKLGGKGIRPVIKVIDDKCLYVYCSIEETSLLTLAGSLILQRTIQFRSFHDRSFRIWGSELRTRPSDSTESSTKIQLRVMCTSQRHGVF